MSTAAERELVEIIMREVRDGVRDPKEEKSDDLRACIAAISAERISLDLLEPALEAAKAVQRAKAYWHSYYLKLDGAGLGLASSMDRVVLQLESLIADKKAEKAP